MTCKCFIVSMETCHPGSSCSAESHLCEIDYLVEWSVFPECVDLVCAERGKPPLQLSLLRLSLEQQPWRVEGDESVE